MKGDTPSSKDLEILYEDNHLIAVNKKSGDIVQGDNSGDVSLLEIVKSYIKEKHKKPGDVFLGLPHRIDRPVGGVVVFARTGKALERMTALFRNREVKKTYIAIVKNKPRQQTETLINYLKKDSAKNKSFVFKDGSGGAVECELSYLWFGSLDNYHILKVNPKSGRHHQIRVQLSHIGMPIKGDLKYGADRSNPDGSISLHAYCLEFIHPVKKSAIKIQAPVPDEKLWQSAAVLLSQ